MISLNNNCDSEKELKWNLRHNECNAEFLF